MKILAMLILSVFSCAAIAECMVSGCSREICSDKADEQISTCQWKEEFQCYKDFGICEQDANGKCGWRQSDELRACLNSKEYSLTPS